MLILSNDRQIIEILMSDRYYLTTFGALEYNRDNIRENVICSYRDDLKNRIKFKQVI